jgi:hypothetical protein
MYLNILLITLLGSLPLIPALALPSTPTSSAIVDQPYPTECANYPGYTAGRYASELPSEGLTNINNSAKLH